VLSTARPASAVSGGTRDGRAHGGGVGSGRHSTPRDVRRNSLRAMESVDADLIVRATIGRLVITAPFDPVKLLFSNEVLRGQEGGRTGRSG
jgi:hypothetical protein